MTVKYLNLIALMCLLVNGGACSTKQEVVITIDVREQPEVHTLIYTVPLSGTSYYFFSDTLKAKGTGKFELKLELKQPSFITVSGSQMYVKMLVEPGCKYHIFMYPKNDVQITGDNERGQMLYSTALLDPIYIEWGMAKFFNPGDHVGDTLSPAFVHHKISGLKQSDMSKFKDLLDEGEITKSFFDLVKKDRDCFYAALEAFYLVNKIYYDRVERGMKIEDEVLQTLKKIYEQYPPTDERFLFSPCWPEYACLYITKYRPFVQDGFDVEKMKAFEKMREFETDRTFYTYVINESKKYLSGKMLEFFRARYIHDGCFVGRYSLVSIKSKKELIPLFEQFEKDYPQSEYSKYIRPYMDEIVSYHQTAERPFDKDISFLEGAETFNTLEDVIQPLRGKKTYITVWATRGFSYERVLEHNDELKKILAENDVQQLYICFDFEADDWRINWEYLIKFYHLTGSHMRANDSLRYSLHKRLDRTPWYILVDENGHIIEESPFPMEKDKR